MDTKVKVYVLFVMTALDCSRNVSCDLPQPFKFSESVANSFLTDLFDYSADQCIESNCERYSNKDCMGEVEKYRRVYDSHCKDACQSYPCLHGGTCHDDSIYTNTFSCDCKTGYTGKRCEIDINDCINNKCANGSTCVDHVNYYTCECPKKYYGIYCNTNVCHPTPADVVFVLDSSYSMTEKQFIKQLEFVANFTDKVLIGSKDFQISVITFSFDAHVEFYLNNFTTNETLKAALKDISFKPGATFTHKALDKVRSIFNPDNGGHRIINGTLPNRFVFLLTDGMSTLKGETKKYADILKNSHQHRLQIYSIGIGNQVSHEELLDIASHPSNVYSAKDFDSLYSVLKKLVQLTCEECKQKSVTEVALFVDISKDINFKHLDECREAIDYLVNDIDTDMDVRISLSSFDTSVNPVFLCSDKLERRSIFWEINRLQLSDSVGSKIEITDLLTYISTSAFKDARPNSKRMAIIFTDGLFPSQNQGQIDIKRQEIRNKNITMIYVGIGDSVNLDRIFSIVDDAYDVYLLDPTSKRNLDALKSYMTYGVCTIEDD